MNSLSLVVSHMSAVLAVAFLGLTHVAAALGGNVFVPGATAIAFAVLAIVFKAAYLQYQTQLAELPVKQSNHKPSGLADQLELE